MIAGIFCAGGDSRFGLFCDAVTMWAVTVPLGLLTAFLFLKYQFWLVYFIINLDEIIKLAGQFTENYKKYKLG